MKSYFQNFPLFTIKISPLLIGLIVSIYFHSRAFSIGFIIALVIIFLLSTKFVFSRKIYLQIGLGILALLLFSVFFFKSDSSLGRVFIYKISANIYKDNWFYGVGIGEFKHTYMYYQAAYFKLGKFMGKEFLLADNTYFAFNDYFQFIIEMGLVGIFTILLFFAGLYKLVVTTLAKSRSLILLNSIGILLAICFASCFNFILYRPEFQMIAIVCLTIILYYYSINTDLWKKTFMIIVILLTISLYLGVNGLTLDYYLALEKLKEAKELERAGYRMEAMAITKDLEKKLSTDPEYLELTSFIFTNAMMLKEAKKETHKLIEARPSSDAYLRLGHIYELKNEYPEAERAYLMSIDMVPNRFVSRYKLYQFYKSTGQYEKAKMSAKVILNMPIKIPSVIVDQIKSNVKKDIF